MFIRSLLLGLVGLATTSAHAQVELTGTLETFFITSPGVGGFAHSLSWGEFHLRLNPEVRATFSFTELPGRTMYDEVLVEFQKGSDMLRLGRLRTNFGFSNWSELFYNGFNHRPVVRNLALIDGVRLLRNDVGVEFTTTRTGFQTMVALVDTRATAYEVGFTRLNAGIARIETYRGPFIVGIDLLNEFENDDRIYGFDLRYTVPFLQVRAEAFAGAGTPNAASGYYVDAAYRLPGLTRTQLVGRTEGFDGAQGKFDLHTLGARQVVGDSLWFNLNYAWNGGTRPGQLGTRAREGWTLMTTFRVTF